MPLPRLSSRLVPLLTALIATMALAAGNPFTAHQWQHRLLLVFAPEAEDPRLLAQVNLLAEHHDGFVERDLITIHLRPDENVKIDLAPSALVAAREIYRSFDIGDDEFAVLLIGKDGGVKLQRDLPVNATTIFDLIDSMPMRQWEMQNSAQG